MKGEEGEGHFNKLAKNSLKIAVRSTGKEDQKHTSGGVSIAIDGAMPSVVDKEKGAVRTIPGNEGRIPSCFLLVRSPSTMRIPCEGVCEPMTSSFEELNGCCDRLVHHRNSADKNPFPTRSSTPTSQAVSTQDHTRGIRPNTKTSGRTSTAWTAPHTCCFD